jgi:hypothetical protein
VKRRATEADLLGHVLETLQTRGWCQRSPARNAGGDFVWPDDPAAVAFSPVGAMMRAAHAFGLPFLAEECTVALNAIRELGAPGYGLPHCALADWNDAELSGEAFKRFASKREEVLHVVTRAHARFVERDQFAQAIGG